LSVYKNGTHIRKKAGEPFVITKTRRISSRLKRAGAPVCTTVRLFAHLFVHMPVYTHVSGGAMIALLRQAADGLLGRRISSPWQTN
jgi:hypothetical protein